MNGRHENYPEIGDSHTGGDCPGGGRWPCNRKGVNLLEPGDVIWLNRKRRGVLGSRDVKAVVKTAPDRVRGFSSVFFDAHEYRHGSWHLITVATGPDSGYELAEPGPM